MRAVFDRRAANTRLPIFGPLVRAEQFNAFTRTYTDRDSCNDGTSFREPRRATGPQVKHRACVPAACLALGGIVYPLGVEPTAEDNGFENVRPFTAAVQRIDTGPDRRHSAKGAGKAFVAA